MSTELLFAPVNRRRHTSSKEVGYHLLPPLNTRPVAPFTRDGPRISPPLERSQPAIIQYGGTPNGRRECSGVWVY